VPRVCPECVPGQGFRLSRFLTAPWFASRGRFVRLPYVAGSVKANKGNASKGSGLANFHERSSKPDRSMPMRFSMSARYSASRSIKTHLRPSMKLAAPVVPVPANGSRTVAPFGQTSRTSHCMRSTGLTVGCLLFSLSSASAFRSVEEPSGAARIAETDPSFHSGSSSQNRFLRSIHPASLSPIRKPCHHFGRAIMAEIGWPAALALISYKLLASVLTSLCRRVVIGPFTLIAQCSPQSCTHLYSERLFPSAEHLPLLWLR
jgi:hypothetical protein